MYHIIRTFGIYWVSFLAMAATQYVNGPTAMFEGGKITVGISTIISAILYAINVADLDSNRQIRGLHMAQAAIRGTVMAIIPIILAIKLRSWECLLLVPLAYSFYWLVFELWLNSLKDDPAFYVGTQAFTDKAVRWLNANTFLVRFWPWWYLGLKLLLIALSMVLLTLYYL